MKALLLRLEDWLAARDPQLLASLRSGASARDLDAVAGLFERPLPEDLRALYAWRDGQSGKGALPVVASAGSGGQLHESSFMSLKAMTGVVETHRRWRTELQRSKAWWHDDFLPILDGGDGDFVVVDLASGALREFQHETPERPVAHESIRGWLESILVS